MELEDFRNFIYKTENLVDELVIVLLSLGAITMAMYTFFIQSPNYIFTELGKNMFYWLVPLGLMIIGRELWLMNRKIHTHVYEDGDEE